MHGADVPRKSQPELFSLASRFPAITALPGASTRREDFDGLLGAFRFDQGAPIGLKIHRPGRKKGFAVRTNEDTGKLRELQGLLGGIYVLRKGISPVDEIVLVAGAMADAVVFAFPSDVFRDAPINLFATTGHYSGLP